jgi:hypothetical protein
LLQACTLGCTAMRVLSAAPAHHQQQLAAV